MNLTPKEAQAVVDAMTRGMQEAADQLDDLAERAAYAIGRRDARLGLGGYYSGRHAAAYLAGLHGERINHRGQAPGEPS